MHTIYMQLKANENVIVSQGLANMTVVKHIKIPAAYKNKIFFMSAPCADYPYPLYTGFWFTVTGD